MRSCQIVVVLLALCMMAPVSQGGEHGADQSVAVTTSGVQLALTKRDGEFVPLSQSQKQQLLDSLKTGLRRNGYAKGQGKIVTRADQVAQFHLGEAHAMITVATKDASGNLQTQCVQGAEAAADVLSSAGAIK